jgi:hypothetical protein
LAAIHADASGFAIFTAAWPDAERIPGAGKAKLIRRSVRQPAAQKEFFRSAE